MSQEVIYTSAPQGLRPGSFGFCTVAATPGMASSLAERLESLSGYRHLFPPGDPQAVLNPVVHSHLIVKVGGRRLHILSRIADAGLDYSQRSNKLAHHVALDASELPLAPPAWVAAQPGFLDTQWSGAARLLRQGRTPPASNPSPQICQRWREATGDPGWAGVLAQHALDGRRPAYLIVSRGFDPLPLLVESQLLLPERKRWEVTFSTYYTQLPAGVDCLWRCVVEGTPEALTAGSLRGDVVIDLTRTLGAPPGGQFVDAARSGVLPLEVIPERQPAAAPALATSHRPQTAALPLPPLPSADDMDYQLGPPPVGPQPTLRPPVQPLSSPPSRKTRSVGKAWKIAAVIAAQILLLIAIGGGGFLAGLVVASRQSQGTSKVPGTGGAAPIDPLPASAVSKGHKDPRSHPRRTESGDSKGRPAKLGSQTVTASSPPSDIAPNRTVTESGSIQVSPTPTDSTNVAASPTATGSSNVAASRTGTEPRNEEPKPAPSDSQNVAARPAESENVAEEPPKKETSLPNNKITGAGSGKHHEILVAVPPREAVFELSTEENIPPRNCVWELPTHPPIERWQLYQPNSGGSGLRDYGLTRLESSDPTTSRYALSMDNSSERLATIDIDSSTVKLEWDRNAVSNHSDIKQNGKALLLIGMGRPPMVLTMLKPESLGPVPLDSSGRITKNVDVPWADGKPRLVIDSVSIGGKSAPPTGSTSFPLFIEIPESTLVLKLDAQRVRGTSAMSVEARLGIKGKEKKRYWFGELRSGNILECANKYGAVQSNRIDLQAAQARAKSLMNAPTDKEKQEAQKAADRAAELESAVTHASGEFRKILKRLEIRNVNEHEFGDVARLLTKTESKERPTVGLTAIWQLPVKDDAFAGATTIEVRLLIAGMQPKVER